MFRASIHHRAACLALSHSLPLSLRPSRSVCNSLTARGPSFHSSRSPPPLLSRSVRLEPLVLVRGVVHFIAAARMLRVPEDKTAETGPPLSFLLYYLTAKPTRTHTHAAAAAVAAAAAGAAVVAAACTVHCQSARARRSRPAAACPAGALGMRLFACTMPCLALVARPLLLQAAAKSNWCC